MTTLFCCIHTYFDAKRKEIETWFMQKFYSRQIYTVIKVQLFTENKYTQIGKVIQVQCTLGWVSFFIIGSNDKTSLVIPEKARNFGL